MIRFHDENFFKYIFKYNNYFQILSKTFILQVVQIFAHYDYKSFKLWKQKPLKNL